MPGNIRGILWLSIGAFLFSVTDVIVKQLGRKFDPTELALFRYGIGMMILTPVFLKMGIEELKTKRIGMHIVRMSLAMAAQLGIFITVINHIHILIHEYNPTEKLLLKNEVSNSRN